MQLKPIYTEQPQPGPADLQKLDKLERLLTPGTSQRSQGQAEQLVELS